MSVPGWTRGLLVLGLGGLLIAGSLTALFFSQDAGAETQQTGTPLSNPTTSTTQAGQATKLTPEQEAALVEVRNILKEAQEVAAAIQVPSRPLTDRHRVKALEQAKAQLLDDIDKAQLRAGDFHAAGMSKHVDLLALAQAAYGKTQDAVQTTSRPRLIDGDPLLILVDMFTRGGDFSAALKAVDAMLIKGVTQWDHAQRARHRAETLALIAQRQHERGDPAAKVALQEALAAAQDVIVPDESYWAFIQVARVQGLVGDQAGSTESIRQALKAARGRRNEEPSSEKLMWIAKAQAEAGNAAASQQTFQQAIQERKGYGDMTCLAWAQDVTGNHQAAVQSLKLAVDDAEKLPREEQVKALHYIVPWQMKLNDREAAVATIEKLRKAGALVNAEVLAARFGFLDAAMAIDAETPKTDEEKASWLRVFAKRLIETGSALGTPEKLKQLSLEATAPSQGPLPKDKSKSGWMLTHIALTQAASGELAASMQTIERIGEEPQQTVAYADVTKIILLKGDMSTAKKIAAGLKEERRPFTTIFRNIGRGYGDIGDMRTGLEWGRQQQNPYANANALFGVAQGLMKRHGIETQLFQEVVRQDRCPDLFNYDQN